MPFSQEDLDLLAATEEILIETRRPDGSTRKTIIWVMTDGDDVFVRSELGDRGRWYQAALAEPLVTIYAGNRSIAARAMPATDIVSVEACSAALKRKYGTSSSLGAMLEPKTLGSTLRLEPA